MRDFLPFLVTNISGFHRDCAVGHAEGLPSPDPYKYSGFFKSPCASAGTVLECITVYEDEPKTAIEAKGCAKMPAHKHVQIVSSRLAVGRLFWCAVELLVDAGQRRNSTKRY